MSEAIKERNYWAARTRNSLQAILDAKSLLVPCRNFTFPHITDIRPDATIDAELSVSKLLGLLGLADKISEVFENEAGNYTGAFTADGMQRLSNLLNKPIVFAYQANREPIIDRENALTFQPNNLT